MERTSAAPTSRTAAIWTALRAEMDRRPGQTPHVVDVGGGTGGFAVPLAEAGCQVIVIDASPDALASLARRAADAGVAHAITAMQGDGDALGALVDRSSADIVLCHSVLEEVDDPAEVMAAVAASLRPNGIASVVVANRAGAALARAIAGHLEAAVALVRRDEPGRRRFDSAEATALVRAAGLDVEAVHGVRVVSDLIAVADPDPDALLAFETAAASQAPYRDIATQLHVLARRRD